MRPQLFLFLLSLSYLCTNTVLLAVDENRACLATISIPRLIAFSLFREHYLFRYTSRGLMTADTEFIVFRGIFDVAPWN